MNGKLQFGLKKGRTLQKSENKMQLIVFAWLDAGGNEVLIIQ